MDWRLTLDWRDRNVASTRAFICLGVSQTRVSPAARTHSTSDFASTHAKSSMNHDSFHEMCTATGVGGRRNLVYFILDRQRVCAKLPNSETHGHAICSKIARRPHSAGPQGGLVELQGAARGERVRLHVHVSCVPDRVLVMAPSYTYVLTRRRGVGTPTNGTAYTYVCLLSTVDK